MGTFEFTLITLGLLVLVFGLLFMALVLIKNRSRKVAECTPQGEATKSFGCGCGTGACGAPLTKP